MNEYDQFFALLAHYPFLARYWKRDRPGCDITSLERAIAHMSTGEAIIAKAIASIWSGNGSDYRIDFTDFALLDPSARQPLIEWLQAPFFP